MQTTLLGLAIALILALIAALIGPHFIDWNQFRPQFEAEATRIVGAPVRVSGELQARLLPTPSLRLGSVTLGGPDDLGKVHADKLDVEFSLGDLMRGQWRANELTVSGMSVDLGLGRDGKIDWPASNGKFDWASLAIDRLNLTGRVALHDAASRSTLELNDITFSGDVRSLAGVIRGDGDVTVEGTRYPFRISSGQTTDGNGTRVHLNIDPGQRPVAAELAGVLTFEARAPHFKGALTLAVPPAPKAKPGQGRTPWKITAKLKADDAAAQFEQIQASYGSEEGAVKASGVGEMRFGASPLLRVALSARQFDADRLFGKDKAGNGSIEPARLWPGLHALMAEMPHPPFPVRIQASSEQIMLGGRPLQKLSAELRGDATAWAIDRLDVDAPGSTHVAFVGTPSSHTIAGALDIDSSDPDVLMAWLQGRGDVIGGSEKPLRLHGDVAVKPDGVTLDGLKAEIGGGTIGGRLALSAPSATAGLRLDTALHADQLDLDAAASFVRSIAGPNAEWPEQATVSLNVDRAQSAGQELRPFAVKFSYSPKLVALEQLKVGQASGVSIEGSGNFDRNDATGVLALRAAGNSLGQLTALIAPMAPAIAQRINNTGVPAGPARLKLALNVGKDADHADRADARMTLDLNAPQLEANAIITARPQLTALRGIDFDALRRSNVTASTKLSAQRGQVLLALLGLDHAIGAGEGPAQFEGSVSGKWREPLDLKAKMTGAGIDAGIQGTVEPWTPDARANLNLRVRKADLRPLFGLKPSDTLAQNISLSSHVTLAGNKLTFDDLDSTAATSRLRGHLAVTLGDQREVQGEIGFDALELAPVFAVAIGAAGHDASEPLAAGFLQGWHGRIAFQALRGELPGGIELRPVSGTVRSDGQSITLDQIKGTVGGGEATATIDARNGTNGLALNAHVELKGVDGAALHFRDLKMPAKRTSLQLELTSQGRSVSALSGALSGNGTVTLQGASIMGLNPRAFDVAVHAGDSGQLPEDAKLRQIVAPVLASGSLQVASAQIPFTIRDGRLRVGATTLDGKGAGVIVSGGYDIPADQADVRATLASTTIGSGNSHPEIQLFMAGPPGALSPSIDVTSLSSWLAVRAIDRETRRLDAIERGERPPPGPTNLPPSAAALPPARPEPTPSKPRPPAAAPAVSHTPAAVSQQVAPLPPPINVRPPPGPPPAHTRSRPRLPLVLTPPSTTNP